MPWSARFILMDATQTSILVEYLPILDMALGECFIVQYFRTVLYKIVGNTGVVEVAI